MTAPPRRPLKRPNMRRAVILFPSGLTLGNLFFGIFAIIAASRLEFTTAGVYVLLGGICDALDGRVARATNAGTEFGEELDSLVDAITFGLAPGMIMYFAVLNRDGWDWVWVFLFSACAVMRLARFNIEQAGTAKTYFQGLPSPAAGITLAPQAGDRGMVAAAHRASGGCCPTPIDESKPDEEGVSCQLCIPCWGQWSRLIWALP